MLYCEWYGVCNFVVLSVVEVCADYGGVKVLFVLILALSMVLGLVSMSVLLFATTRSVVKSIKVSVVEVAKRTN